MTPSLTRRVKTITRLLCPVHTNTLRMARMAKPPPPRGLSWMSPTCTELLMTFLPKVMVGKRDGASDDPEKSKSQKDKEG